VEQEYAVGRRRSERRIEGGRRGIVIVRSRYQTTMSEDTAGCSDFGNYGNSDSYL
jgi:hypothetical protein